jgi:hypothetical protein
VKAFALADNRSAELAEWDEEVLSSQLLELQEANVDVTWLDFDLAFPEKEKELEDFTSFDEHTETAYRCPKCHYEWNGATR